MLRKLIPFVPLTRLCIETDAPYLGFTGCRALAAGKKKQIFPNVPMALPTVAQRVAEAAGCDVSALAEVSTRNAVEFFGLGA